MAVQMADAPDDGDDPDAVSRLIFCTEHGQVHVLSADARAVQVTHQLPIAVSFVAVTTGSRAEGKHFIACACRDGRVYVARDGAVDDALTIDLEAPACGLATVGGNVVLVACADDTAHAYALADHARETDGEQIIAGQKVYALYFPSSVAATTTFDVDRRRRLERVAFSLRGGEIAEPVKARRRVNREYVGVPTGCIAQRTRRRTERTRWVLA